MKFDFYYGDESEQYSFYSVPKMFFTNDSFTGLSAMSKLLYSFLLDRMSLSRKRNWIDDKNRAYIKYSLKSICSDMGVSRNSVIKYMRELQEFGLIMKFSKEGMEDIIYVMDFSKVRQMKYEENITDAQPEQKAGEDSYNNVNIDYSPPGFNNVCAAMTENDNLKTEKNVNQGITGKYTYIGGANIEPVQNPDQFKECTSSNIVPVQILHHPHQKLNNNIYNINNKTTNKYKSKMDNDIYKSHPSINPDKHTGNDNTNTADRELIGQAAFSEYDFICGQVKSDINYDEMMTRADCADWYSDYYSLIVEILTRKSDVIRISGEEYSMQLVKKRFSMLTAEHLVYVHNQVSKAKGIKNIKAYLIKSLFNAPVTHISFIESNKFIENNVDKTETKAKNNSNVKYAGNRFNNFQQRDKKSDDWYNTLLNNND